MSATQFARDVRAWLDKVDGRQQALFVNTASAVKASIQHGSPVTGAPGQPVDTGALRASWTLDFESAVAASIFTNMAYAPGIEDGVSMQTGKPLRLRSEVGGFHSVKLTRAAFRELVFDEARKLGAPA